MTVITGPAAPAQQRLWLLDQLYPDNWSYHIESSLDLTGTLEVPVLRRAVGDLAARHEALRTTFAEEGGELVLRVADRVVPRFEQADLSGEPDPRRAALERSAAVRREPMDLTAGPLFRVLLCRTGPAEHTLTLFIHHILADGWSLGVLWEDLGRLYSRRLGPGPAPEPAGLPYREHAALQTARQRTPEARAELDRWLERLRGVEPDNSLRADLARPPVPSFRGRTLELELPAELAGALREAARSTGNSLFMLLAAGFAADLAHYDRRTEVVVATQSSGRADPRVARTVGFFVDTLPLRFELEGDPTLAQVVEQAKEGTLAAYAAEYVTYDRLAQELSPSGDRSRNPLAQVAFQLMNVPIPPVVFGDLAVRRRWDTTSAAKFDLNVMLVPDGEGLLGLVTYAVDLFEEETVREIWRTYLHVLGLLVRDPQARLWQLPLLDGARQAEVAARSVGPALPADGAPDLLAALERWSRQDGGRTAVTAAGRRIGYAELWSGSGAVAAALREAGAEPGEVVAVACAARADTVLAVVGAWRAGAGVLVLEPGPLSPRAEGLLDELKVTTGVLGPGEPPRVPGLRWVATGGAAEVPPRWAAGPDATAYVVSTSGSTGRPRTVAASMGAFAGHVLRGAAGLDRDRVVVQVPPPSFDPGMRDVFTTLAAGAELVIPDGVEDNPVDAVASVLAEGRADTLLAAVPGVLEAVALQLERQGVRPALRTVRCCGEALPRSVAELVVRVLGCVPHNDYGPSEATMVSVSGHTDPDRVRTTTMPIGRPLPGVGAWVLGPAGQLLPPCFTGEIHLSGPHLTAGYLGDPEATAERFVHHPGIADGERLHRTGDLGRYAPDGRLHWLARADRQAKVRGMRIDLVEVETVLSGHPAVLDAVATPHGEGTRARLVAYAVAPGATGTELRDHLRARLPRGSVPSVVELVEAIPRSARGKVQWSLLPEPRPVRTGSAPLTEAFEAEVAEIWREVLGRAEVSAEDDFFDLLSAEDDFFELGGHSLAAMQLAARLTVPAGRPVTVQDVFDHPTLRELAAFARPLTDAPDTDD
ncbi:condensation domain-containing protein [Streptomyces sp. NBC_01335]|uniref:non-ribosomal peptide synthetase n=1 Tax=Streptomyces sp. NBC_01335 TaxID=2903828 RepID=UPI002E13F2D0|nr:condensation domain-containing protein [Streptomyces sp. NBC_01335]